MTIYSLDVLFYQFWTSPLFHVPYLVLTVAYWPAYRFLRRQIRRSGTPNSKNFPQFVVIHTVKCFSVVNEAEVDVFLAFSYFFYDPVDVGNLISGSSAFFWISKFTVHVLLNPGLENFEHYFASVWYECNCAVVWVVTVTEFILGGSKITAEVTAAMKLKDTCSLEEKLWST